MAESKFVATKNDVITSSAMTLPYINRVITKNSNVR